MADEKSKNLTGAEVPDAGPDKAKAPEQAAPVQPDKAAEAPKTEKVASVSVFNFSEIMAEKKAAEKVGTQQKPPKEQTQPSKRRGRPPKDERIAAPAQKDEQIVYLKLSDLHAFKNHPFQVRDDEEMKAMVSSVKDKGVTQPLSSAPVRMAAMRSCQATVARRPASLPDLWICRVSSVT